MKPKKQTQRFTKSRTVWTCLHPTHSHLTERVAANCIRDNGAPKPPRPKGRYTRDRNLDFFIRIAKGEEFRSTAANIGLTPTRATQIFISMCHKISEKEPLYLAPQSNTRAYWIMRAQNDCSAWIEIARTL
jgi:hypothetical protein